MSDTPVNIDKLEEMKQVMGEVFDQLVPAYLDQSDEMINAMPDLLETNTIDVLERHAHSMKSSSLNMGAETLSEIARILEQMSRDKEDSALLKEKVDLISAEYAQVRDILQNYIQQS